MVNPALIPNKELSPRLRKTEYELERLKREENTRNQRRAIVQPSRGKESSQQTNTHAKAPPDTEQLPLLTERLLLGGGVKSVERRENFRRQYE